VPGPSLVMGLPNEAMFLACVCDVCANVAKVAESVWVIDVEFWGKENKDGKLAW
jgi:hypothetical protein